MSVLQRAIPAPGRQTAYPLDLRPRRDSLPHWGDLSFSSPLFSQQEKLAWLLSNDNSPIPKSLLRI